MPSNLSCECKLCSKDQRSFVLLLHTDIWSSIQTKWPSKLQDGIWAGSIHPGIVTRVNVVINHRATVPVRSNIGILTTKFLTPLFFEDSKDPLNTNQLSMNSWNFGVFGAGKKQARFQYSSNFISVTYEFSDVNVEKPDNIRFIILFAILFNRQNT